MEGVVDCRVKGKTRFQGPLQPDCVEAVRPIFPYGSEYILDAVNACNIIIKKHKGILIVLTYEAGKTIHLQYEC